jgi:hypothetical protein
MRMRRAVISGSLIGVLVLALSAASAGAVAGSRPFGEVYPVASALCAKASAGTPPKRLEASRSQVSAACTTLSSEFTSLTSAVSAAETTYVDTRAAEHAKVTTVCPPASAAGRVTCRTTRLTAHATDASALLARHDAIVLYHTSLEANRVTFWATIHSLRGGAGIRADPPIPQPTPQQNPS